VSGAKFRAYYVLRHLANRHEVTLLSFIRQDDRPEYIAHLEGFLNQVYTVPMQRSFARNVRAVLVSLITGKPAIIAREEIIAMRARVRELLASNSFDVVHADQIPMAQYGLLGKEYAVQRILDQHNATFQIIERMAGAETSMWKRILLECEARAFARYEVDVYRRFNQVTFVTHDDRQTLFERMGQSGIELNKTAVIPICIDTDLVKPVDPVPAPFRVIYLGTMNWPPNIEGILWLWESVWPLVKKRYPGARLTIIGKNPPANILALGEQQDVDVPGYVEDPTPYMKESAVFIVPLYAAGGMRVKIVDAWCWGLPVVSTAIGAEGIAIRDGENILIADSPNNFAQAIVRLLKDKELQSRMRANGRKWVEEHYNWRRVYSAWDEVYGRMVEA
jgi:glycosyltransferase involved in cell wall biosynthesis